MENEDENEDYAETMKENIDWGCPVSFKDNFLVNVGHDGYEKFEKSRQVLNDKWQNIHEMKRKSINANFI